MRGTIELSSGSTTAVAGQDLIVYASLPPEFAALRPDAFEIDDAQNWAIK